MTESPFPRATLVAREAKRSICVGGTYAPSNQCLKLYSHSSGLVVSHFCPGRVRSVPWFASMLLSWMNGAAVRIVFDAGNPREPHFHSRDRRRGVSR